MHRHPEHQDPIDAQFDALLRQALDEYRVKQAAFAKVMALFTGWHIDEEAATLLFTGSDGQSRSFQVTPIATYLPELEDLAWTWANDAYPASARHKASRIRTLSERTGYRIFETPHFRASPTDVDELCAIALQHLGGTAVFKAKGQTPWIYYVIE